MKIFLFILTCLSSTCTLALDSVALKSIIDKSVSDHQEIENTGVSISVFNKDQILYQAGYGYKNREAKLPITSKTLFAIGSTTKAFTALDLKFLENDHQLNFSDKVKDHLLKFKLSNEMITNEATIEDLLSHRIGLPRHDLLGYFSPFSRRELFSRLQFLDFPPQAEEKFRKTFQYNNLLIMTAGILVEEKSHLSWEEFTQKNILDVLHMDSTVFGVPKNLDQIDVATPYYQEEKLDHKDISPVGPAGSMYSNADDMTKWIQSFMQKRWPGQDDFFKQRIAMNPKLPIEYGYGLAWMRNSLMPKYTWNFHGGNIDGFSTLVLFSPELDLGMVIMVNQNGSGLPDAIVGDILQASIKEKEGETKSFFKIFPTMKLDRTFLAKKEKDLSLDETTVFHHPGYGDISLIVKDNELAVNYYGHISPLIAIDKDGYNYQGGGEIPLPFKVESDFLEVPFEPQVSNIHFQK